MFRTEAEEVLLETNDGGHDAQHRVLALTNRLHQELRVFVLLAKPLACFLVELVEACFFLELLVGIAHT